MPRRKKKKDLNVAPVFHIFCEGEKTEPYYINGYINHYHSDKRTLVIVEDTNKNTPVQLVDIAIAHKKTNTNENDVYWVVFDRESIAKYTDKLHLKAETNAKMNGIEIALSNVCFEFWLLLHLKYTTACYQNYNDLIKNSDLKILLKAKGIKDYDKADIYLFDTLKDKLPDAIKFSEKVKNNALSTAVRGKESPCFLNPYTDIHELFIDIHNFIDGEESIRKIDAEKRKEQIEKIISLL